MVFLACKGISGQLKLEGSNKVKLSTILSRPITLHCQGHTHRKMTNLGMKGLKKLKQLCCFSLVSSDGKPGEISVAKLENTKTQRRNVFVSLWLRVYLPDMLAQSCKYHYLEGSD